MCSKERALRWESEFLWHPESLHWETPPCSSFTKRHFTQPRPGHLSTSYSLLPTSSFLRLLPLHLLFRNTPPGCSTHTYDQLWGWQTISRAAQDWWRQYLHAVESHDGTPGWGGLHLRASAPYSLSCSAHLGILSQETGRRSRTCSTEGEPQNPELRTSRLFGGTDAGSDSLRGEVGSMAVHWCGEVCRGLQLVEF